jgi:MerR family mercuric resistance operon transcriptional regulator
MRIGEVAQEAGVGVETIRYYETRGLIQKPLRPANGGFRVYPVDAVHRIRFVRRAQQLGFALNEISELLELEVDPSTRCADIRMRAEDKLEDVNARIADLKQISGALKKLIKSCPGQGPAQKCSILGTLRNGDGEMR